MIYEFYNVTSKNGEKLVGEEYFKFAVEMCQSFNDKERSMNRDMHVLYDFGDSKIIMPDYKGSHQNISENIIKILGIDKESIDKTILRVEKELRRKYKFGEVKRE